MEQEPQLSPPSAKTPMDANASTRALLALILGILSCLFLGLFAGIPAIILGRKEEKAIARGEAPLAGKTLARIGWILGIVGTALWCLCGIFLEAFFGVFFFFGANALPG